jgi:hypothetical protein
MQTIRYAPGDPENVDPDLPDVTAHLEAIADTAGELEDTSPGSASESDGQPADGVRP